MTKQFSKEDIVDFCTYYSNTFLPNCIISDEWKYKKHEIIMQYLKEIDKERLEDLTREESKELDRRYDEYAVNSWIEGKWLS